MIENIKEALKNYFEDESLINPEGTPGFETGYPERNVNWMRENLIPKIENLIDKNQNSTFLQIVRDLEPPGALTDNVSYDFQFNRVEK